MRRFPCLLALLTLASCVTLPRSDDWPALVGCWVDGGDMYPHPTMVWRPDAAHPGGFIGAWRLENNYDTDAVDFTLTPQDHGRMRFCTGRNDGGVECGVARLNHARPRPGDTAIFYMTATALEFGFTSGTTPFFWGTRGACE